ncbi:MAG: ATP-binding protein [Bacteroidota bacterium]
MKYWEEKAKKVLEKSLKPIPAEVNELDWKSMLSDNSERLAKHLSAFSHLPGGGFMVFGVANDSSLRSVLKPEIDEIIKKLGNIARNNLAQPITIDHTVISYNGTIYLLCLLLRAITNQFTFAAQIFLIAIKRSAGQTVKMSHQEVKTLIAQSQNLYFEDLIAFPQASIDDIIKLLDYDSYFRMSSRPLPDQKKAILDALENEALVKSNLDETWNVTNIGAILFATDLKQFKVIKRKAVRVIVYKSNDRVETHKEHEGIKGYASGFEALIKYILDQLPSNEIIEHALRKEVKMYPEVSIREFVANALIHQDFTITGSGVLIEIFNDRIEITNPGVPLIHIDRFIDTAPKSRNESLASLLRRLKICEERGSGVDRAISAIEVYQLPAPKFVKEADYTKVIIYGHRALSKMDKEDRIRACYQHCCLHYVSNQKTNNQSIRKRFSILEKNYPMASRIISDTINAGLIKIADPDSGSKKHANYIPYWA